MLCMLVVALAVITNVSCEPFVAYSTQSHFTCSTPLSNTGACGESLQGAISQRNVQSTINYLAFGDRFADANTDTQLQTRMRASADAKAPEVVLAVFAEKAHALDAKDFLYRISNILSTHAQDEHDFESKPSSVFGEIDGRVASDDVQSLGAVVRNTHMGLDTTALQALAESHSTIFNDGTPDVITAFVRDESTQGLLDAIRKMSLRTKGRFALVWTIREASIGTGSDVPTSGRAATKQGTTTGATGGNATQNTSSAKGNSTKSNVMNAPELSTAGLTGLLVTALFLIIFIPGFLCLWNIQTPQTFEVVDGTDVRKKMQ